MRGNLLRWGNSNKFYSYIYIYIYIYIYTVKSWTSFDGLEDKATQLRVQRLWVQDWQSSGMGAKRM